MLITDYATYNDIRAALGVSSEELEDATIALNLYVDNLLTELEDIDSTLPSTYATTKALPTPTADQTRFLTASRLFATYTVARHLTGSLPLFSPKDLSDGKATMGRYSVDPYKPVITAINQQYDRFQNKLKEAWATLNVTTVTDTVAKVYVTVITPVSDPVTGT